MGICAVLAIVRLVFMLLGIHAGTSRRGPIVAVAVTFFACAIVSYVLLDSFLDVYIDKHREQLQTTASQVALRITEDELAGVRQAQDFSVMNFDDTSPGKKEIELECAVVSDTMASWSADEWAENRDDLFFNLAAHFNVVCKQAHEFGDLPEGYVVTCPDYMVVYNSQKSRGFIVSATGVYRKTTDPENPLGEPITQVTQDAALLS